MLFLRKHGAKLFFATTCILLAVSFCFSAFSLARFVAHSDAENGAGAAAISCEYTVSGGAGASFINAPYMLKIGRTEPIRMNDWADSEVVVTNTGNYGLEYEMSFVFYFPKEFAESTMLQILELSPDSVSTSSLNRTRAVLKASGLYSVKMDGDKTVGTFEQITQTAGENPVDIPNEYQSFLNTDNELKLGGTAIYNPVYRYSSTVTRTYIANEMNADGSDSKKYMSTVSVSDSEEVDFCKITVTLGNPGQYVIKEGTANARYFKIRLSLRAQVVSEKDENEQLPADAFFANKWNKFAAKYKDMANAAALPSGAIGLPENHSYEWKPGSAAGDLYICEGTAYDEASAKRAYMGECIGVKSPSRLNMIFTQVR